MEETPVTPEDPDPTDPEDPEDPDPTTPVDPKPGTPTHPEKPKPGLPATGVDNGSNGAPVALLLVALAAGIAGIRVRSKVIA